jgi:hypothetical protein
MKEKHNHILQQSTFFAVDIIHQRFVQCIRVIIIVEIGLSGNGWGTTMTDFAVPSKMVLEAKF